MAVRRLQLLNSLLSAYAAYPLAERLQGRGIRPKVVALRAHYALEPRQRRAEARRRLAEVVAFAGDQVPYYRDLFRQIGFDPAKIGKDAKYLQDIPYLTKDIVREHGPRLLSRTLRILPPSSCQDRRLNRTVCFLLLRSGSGRLVLCGDNLRPRAHWCTAAAASDAPRRSFY